MYCRQHLALKVTWEHAAGNFAKLTPQDQWRLHEYFRFSDKLTREQLYEHWLEMKKDPNSSHPHCAGRAYAAMRPFLVEGPMKLVSLPSEKRKKAKPDDHILRVEGLVRPDVDVDKFVKVLMDIAKKGSL
jgi:hypothetical protein